LVAHRRLQPKTAFSRLPPLIDAPSKPAQVDLTRRRGVGEWPVSARSDGDHEEFIKRAHTEDMAASIPNAGLLILPHTSHFAFLQNPKMFNFAILHFLGDE
jgi:pimeloyl-ACP methyl ester carboxylesterase